jgi:hypothetical protein
VLCRLVPLRFLRERSGGHGSSITYSYRSILMCCIHLSLIACTENSLSGELEFIS